MSLSTSLFHPKLTECKKCRTYNYTSRNHPSYIGCYIVSCNLCHCQWYICPEHIKRFNHNNLPKLHIHFTQEHKTIPTMLLPNNNEDDNLELMEDESHCDALVEIEFG